MGCTQHLDLAQEHRSSQLSLVRLRAQRRTNPFIARASPRSSFLLRLSFLYITDHCLLAIVQSPRDTKYNIDDADIQNIDEKECPLRVIGLTKVIISRRERKKYIIQYSNCEQVSLIKCVNITRSVLDPFIIFKGKVQMRDQWDHFTARHIIVSVNKQTINKLCLEQLRNYFKPKSRKY